MQKMQQIQGDSLQQMKRMKGDAIHIVRISQGGGGGGGTRDHNALINRDMEDQHPINAIDQLPEELSVRPAEALTNMEIQAILNT